MKRIIYILTLCAAALTSCTKYLDIKPYGEVIPKTADEFASLLHNILEEIDAGYGLSAESLIGTGPTVADLECVVDNLEANLTSYPTGSGRSIYIGDDLSGKQYTYELIYRIIRDCNIVIGNIEEKDTRLGKDVLGTAYAMRGICYYNLLRDYCEPPVGNLQGLGVPIVTEFDMEARPVRSSIMQTIVQAESDFKAAISYEIEDKMFRFNTDVMEAYLARLYFWTGDWTKAADYAKRVLAKYPLISGQEYVDMMNSLVTPMGNMFFKSYIYDASTQRTLYNSAYLLLSSAPVSRKFVELFHERENDIRFELSFNARREVKKNLFACVRSAEMQLILAESLYHSGAESEALDALNVLRRHRIDKVIDYTLQTLPPVDEDSLVVEDVYGRELTPLLNAILNERRKELFMEGDRWYELKRNGRPEFWVAKQGRKYTTYKFMYTFPFPIQDMELVDGLIQNPGYDKVQ